MTECVGDLPESGQRARTHPGGGGHGHGVTAGSDGRFIAIALGLIVAFLVFEVVMAFVGGMPGTC